MPDSHKKSHTELLDELQRVRALLDEQKNAAIPLLDDVVLPRRPRGSTAAAPRPADLADAIPPASGTPSELPGQQLPPPSEQELDALIDRIIDREMPRIRLELKRVLRDELRLRGQLK